MILRNCIKKLRLSFLTILLFLGGGGMAYEHLWQEMFAVFRSSALLPLLLYRHIIDALHSKMKTAGNILLDFVHKYLLDISKYM